MDNQQTSKIQSKLVIKPKIIQALSACKNHSINLLDSPNHLWDTSDFRVPVSPIFEHSHPIIIKLTFSFPKFVSACKKPAHFFTSFLRYIWQILEFQDLRGCAHFDHKHPITSNNKHEWTPVKHLHVFRHNRTKKQLRYVFLNILQKY